MQREYFRVDPSERDTQKSYHQHPHQHPHHHHQIQQRAEDDLLRRRALVPAHEAERAIRERYLDEANQAAAALRGQTDFASPLPPPPPSSHHHSHIRWSSLRGPEPPSSLMSPESPEDCHPVRHPPSPLHLKKPDSKLSDPPLLMHYRPSIDGPLPHLRAPSHSEMSHVGYPNFLPPHYRPGSMYSNPRMHEYANLPYPVRPSHHQLLQSHQQQSSSRHHHQQPHSLSPSQLSQLRHCRTTPPRSSSQGSDMVKLERPDDDRRRTSPLETSGSLKQRILVRPPDLDLTALEKERSPQPQRSHLHQQQTNSSWKVPESPRVSSKELPPGGAAKESGDKNGSESKEQSTVQLTHPPQYPAHFAMGSLIQLSNGDLKHVEDLTTEDFVRSAEFSHEVGIDHSTVTKLHQVLENGSVTIGFSVGKKKIQVSVEAALEHPFFIIGQGWSSASPQHTLLRYRLPCSQLKVGDVCISLTHRNQALTDGEFPPLQTIEQRTSPSTSGDMRPPPVPPPDKERHRSRSSSPSDRKLASGTQRQQAQTRISPKQVVFSDQVVTHSPPSSPVIKVENGSKIKVEDQSELEDALLRNRQEHDVPLRNRQEHDVPPRNRLEHDVLLRNRQDHDVPLRNQQEHDVLLRNRQEHERNQQEHDAPLRNRHEHDEPLRNRQERDEGESEPKKVKISLPMDESNHTNS